jgi:hypothetical protein
MASGSLGWCKIERVIGSGTDVGERGFPTDFGERFEEILAIGIVVANVLAVPRFITR